MFGTLRSVDDMLTRRARRSLASLANRHPRRRRRRIATLELLEGRTLLTTYTVTSTGTTDVAGTLLYEIDQLDSTGGSSNIINFNIPGTGVQTISPTSALPTITKPVTIEGTATSGVPQIQILGGSAGSSANGLTFGSGSSGSSVQDLVIAGFGSDGIDISSPLSTGDSVVGCWLGINASGSKNANEYGVFVGGPGATIGGTTSGAGNILSGNTQAGIETCAACLVEGNEIGTNVAGTAAVGNAHYGIFVLGSPVTIGGTTTGARNVISGNTGGYGVYFEGSSCLVEGNYIGTNAAGTAAVANDLGIGVSDPGATIGGTGAGAGNVISGNSTDGVSTNEPCLVEGNEIGTNAAGTGAVANGDYGIYVDNASGATTIGGTTTGAGNTISDNSEAGIDVTSGATAAITDNSITGDSTGILVGSGSTDTCVVTVQYDDLSGNTTAGITNEQANASYAVTAIDDWWGSLHGATTTGNLGGNGTGVSSNVSFTPWIGGYTPGTGPGFQPTGITLYAVPTQLVFATEPSSTASPGVAFATQPVVEAEDASGNLGINFDAATVPGAQAGVTLNTLSGTGTLAGTTSVSASGGFASLSGLSITGIGTFTLTASASGFDSLSLSGTSSQIQISVPPSDVVTSTADSGPGTLRAVITSLDCSGESSNAIAFDLGSSGAQTITLASPLPAITVPVDIEGNTEPGFSGVPLVVITGTRRGAEPTA